MASICESPTSEALEAEYDMLGDLVAVTLPKWNQDQLALRSPITTGSVNWSTEFF
jgi:hypothetical protein